MSAIPDSDIIHAEDDCNQTCDLNNNDYFKSGLYGPGMTKLVHETSF